MNQPNEGNTSTGNAKGDDQTRRNNVAPPANGIKPDPRDTAQEAVHQVTPRDEVKKPYTPTPVKAPGISPQAAKGNDEVMSQQEQRS